MASEEEVVAAIADQLYPETTSDEASEAQQTAPEDQHLEAEAEAIDEDDDESTQDDDAKAEDKDDDDGDSDGQSLADYLGIPEDQLVVQDDGSVMIAAKVDGELINIKPQELIKNFQLESHIQRKSQQVAEYERQLQAQAQEKQGQLERQLAESAALAQTAEQQLVAEYNAVPWDELFQNDPGRFAAYKQAYAERAREIDKVKQGVDGKQAELMQERQQQAQQYQQQWMQEQVGKVLAEFPEWQDNEKRTRDMNDLQAFVQQDRYGIRDEALSQIVDPGIIRLIQDAKAYRDGLKSATEKRDPKAKPRFQKPGRRPMPEKVKKQLAARKNLKKTNSLQAFADSIVDQM